MQSDWMMNDLGYASMLDDRGDVSGSQELIYVSARTVLLVPCSMVTRTSMSGFSEANLAKSGWSGRWHSTALSESH